MCPPTCGASAEIEGTQKTDMNTQEGTGSSDNEQATLKERRKWLTERKKALEQASDSYDDTAAEWTKINSLVQDIDKQIERLAGTSQQPQPETVYVNAVKELGHARQMREDIEEHVKDVEAKLANQKDKLLKSAKLVQAGIATVEKAQKAANLVADKNPGGIQVVGMEPGHSKELLDKLQAGGCRFIADPDTRFGECKANWEEQRKPDAENPMTPGVGHDAGGDVLGDVRGGHERPAKHMRKEAP